MVRKHFLVSGRVQGVGFRNFVQRRATALGIEGMVRNLEDGRVEILARGPEGAMSEFEKAVRGGPSHAIVAKVDASDASGAPEGLDRIKGFAVIEDGEAPWFVNS